MAQSATSLTKRILLLTLVVMTGAMSLIAVFQPNTPVKALSGSDWRAGRIIDDAVFNYANSMSIDQIQHFLNSKVPNCDRWGTQAYNGTTRRAYSESQGVQFPLTCLKDYYENTSTKANNLEGRPAPAGAKSAAHIIWEAGQQYSINPQVLLVLLQKEQSLVFDDWPWPKQFRSAVGFACPDTAPCDAEYYGFYNQVSSAARQFRRYANNPNNYNFVPGGNYIRYNPNAACGGSGVYVESQATASLYNYTPYQPNQAALNNLNGTGDGCSAYGNRNFWRMFSDWFGSTTIFDPFGWEVIRTSSDSREYLAVGNTKRWIPSGEIFNDWNLDAKPVRVVSQSYMDGIPTLPTLGRLGFINNRYYYVDGGKKYWLSNDDLLRAWGQYDQRHLAVPAYIPLSTLPDAGEATFYAAQVSEGKVARLAGGQRYHINAADADRWRANPITLTSNAFNTIPSSGPQADYRVSVNGTKYLVDNGRLLNVSNSAMLRDFGQNSAAFVPMPSEIMQIMPTQDTKRFIRSSDSPHSYLLFGGQRYYVSSGAVATAWGSGGDSLVISPKLNQTFSTSAAVLAGTVREQESGKYYLLDGSRHEATGAMLDAMQAPSVTIPTFASEYLAGLPVGNTISSPLVAAQGHIYSMVNGALHHVPNSDVLHAYGSPRKYSPAPVGMSLISSLPASRSADMFLESGGTTYFLQDGNAFSIDATAKSDWLGGRTPINYTSSGFSSRFDAVATPPVKQHVIENNKGLVMSNGYAVDVGSVGDAYDIGAWSSMAVFGMNRAFSLTFLSRSSDTRDSRIWLVSKGTKQHIISGEEMNAYSKGGAVPVSTITPTALATLPQVNAGKKLSPLVYSNGRGFKLLYGNGSFFSFGDGDTLTHYLNANDTQDLSFSVYNDFSQTRGNVSRLIRDPSGKVYWVENGKKRWITSSAAYNHYSANRLVDVTANITNWLPDGTTIN
jgi:hypothetical protein